MKIELFEDGKEIEIPLIYENYDVMDDLYYLKEELKNLIMNRSVVKYFGIDLVWHKRFK